MRRGHSVLERVFENIKEETSGMQRENRLSIPIRAGNDSQETESGISLTDLVYEIYLRFLGTRRSRSIVERAKLIREVAKEAK